ncbi:Werner syndrome ATP-dependent helicase-like [Stylophora pistillata]|nr:Werner syndrome ATP-dependent helicase-like [Stylophora pistillata]
MELFSFRQGIQIIVSPNRKNVKLIVKKVTSDIVRNFSWLAEEVSTKGVECPRTLIYVRNYQTCGELYNFFINTLQDKAYWPTSSLRKSANRMIAMYHSGTTLKIQQHVISSLKYPHGSVRIIIATSALGMGVDMKGLHRVINYGPPNTIEAYVQAFGRVGRDGANSEALLLFHGHQLRLCEPEMLDFVKCTTCRRENILTFFDDIGENSEVIPKHLCCDICENDCQCGETECQGNTESMTFLMSKVTEPTSNLHVRDVTESEKEELWSLLKECQEEMRQEFQQSNLHCLYSSVDQLTCFSDSLINETIDNCDKLNSVESILETLSVWNGDHAIKIFDCLKIVFDDLQ